MSNVVVFASSSPTCRERSLPLHTHTHAVREHKTELLGEISILVNSESRFCCFVAEKKLVPSAELSRDFAEFAVLRGSGKLKIAIFDKFSNVWQLVADFFNLLEHET